MTATIVPNRAEVRGRASGMLVLGWFGLAWAGWGLSGGFPAAVEAPVLTVAGLVFAALIVRAVLMFRQARTLPPGDPETGRAAGRAIGWRFGLIVAAEFIGLFVIARILALTGLTQLIPAIVCLGVGVHFFPLARLFAVPVYGWTGAALCAIAVLTVVLAPLLAAPTLWTALPGFAAALTLDLTAAVLPRSYPAA